MITDYFEDKGIDYWTFGKNVSQGWINIQCVFCDDHSNHLGISLSAKYYNCWLCKEHGNIVNVIMEIEQCGFATANEILANIWEDDFPMSVVDEKRLPPSLRQHEVVLPPISNKWPKKYLNYLESRKFSSSFLIKKYKLIPAHRFGRYSHRIIVPFFMRRKLVTYTGMRTREKQEPPYKDCRKEDSVIPTDETLYNIDNTKNGKAVVVEGVTDVWRIGDGAVGLGTKKINDHQILQLIAKDIKKVLILLDADVSELDERVLSGKLISTFKLEVELGYLERDDPDKMPVEDLIRVQKWLS